MFTLDGRPQFLFIVSYFDGLDASDQNRDADLTYFKTTVKADGVRIFPDWWTWCPPSAGGGCSAPPTTCGGDGRFCTLMNGYGQLNVYRLDRLKAFVDAAYQRGLIVDLSWSRDVVRPNGTPISSQAYRDSLTAVASELRDRDYLLFDVQNEWNVVNAYEGFGDSWETMRSYADAVRSGDPHRIVVASYAGSDLAGAHVAAQQVNLDAFAYHDPRDPGPPWQWHVRTTTVANDAIGGSPRPLPLYLQEPERWNHDPTPEHYREAITRAKARGAAAWVFHTETSFDLGTSAYVALASQTERDALASLNNGPGSAAATFWGPDDVADGLKDTWANRYTVQPYGDEDGDGVLSKDEFSLGSHPRGAYRRYFAEGVVTDHPLGGVHFKESIAILNPTGASARVHVRVQQSKFAERWHPAAVVDVEAQRQRVIDLRAIAGPMGGDVSVELEADRDIVADRRVMWGRPGFGEEGSHLERALPAPSRTWFMAEGATHSGLDTYYLLQNPHYTASATVRIRYFVPGGLGLEKDYLVPPRERVTIAVDMQTNAAGVQVLANTDVAGEITVLGTGPAILAERAVYLGTGWQAGHGSAGVTAAATSWWFAEGATGPFFDAFLLIVNPNNVEARGEIRYYLDSGQLVLRPYAVPPHARHNVWVDLDPQLANLAFAASVHATNGIPVVAERAMWWPGAYPQWYEAHNSPGTTAAGTHWALADAEVNADTETYLLFGNPNAAIATANVELMCSDGGPYFKAVSIPAWGRANLTPSQVPGVGGNRKCGAMVSATLPIIVERAIYRGAGWTSGGAALATRLQ